MRLGIAILRAVVGGEVPRGVAALFAITAGGPGAHSLEWGAGWAIAQLAAGVGGAAAMLRWAHAQDSEPQAQLSLFVRPPA